ncbi:MAG: hypothetical protein ACK448_01135 [Bacteroidota bacterium]|jgi:hypothetical protein
MSKLSIYALIVLGFTAFLSSCQIEKQYHSGGFKIHGPQWGISANESTKAPPQHEPSKSNTLQKTKESRGITTYTTSKKSNGQVMKSSNEADIENAKNSLNSKGFLLLNCGNNLHKSNRFFPPDTVVIYDTVFEEDVLIVPNSIKTQSDSLLLKSKEIRKKSYLPLFGAYLLLTSGSTGVFLAAIIALFSMGNEYTIALLLLGASILALLLGVLLLVKGSKLDVQARMMARKSKELLKPYEQAKPAKKPMKKSSKKILYIILGAYLLLRIGLVISGSL